MKINKEFSSFRDPAGYIYYENGDVYRKINKSYIDTYDFFVSSGLYKKLLDEKLIVEHEEIKRSSNEIVLKVEKIPFISYPYEWCYDEYIDAALLTVKINLIALKYGMILKDATAYNVQFKNGKPVFIDTLSFEKYVDGNPWLAYGQFTRHFIAPLSLMSYVDERLNVLMKNYIDGLPLDMVDSILKGRGNMFTKQHITWQNKSIIKYNDVGSKEQNIKIKISKKSVINILKMVESQILKLNRKNKKTEWDNYYSNTNYSEKSELDKNNIIKNYLEKIKDIKDIALDVGANDGKYSQLLINYFDNVISVDIDTNAVNRNYLNVSKSGKNILPLVYDINNSTPSIGFSCKERKSFEDRVNVNLVVALAIIHHIAISNNVSLDNIADWFQNLGKYLIIEFVPKEDSQVKLLLKTRNDIFDKYDVEEFEKSFSKYYKIITKNKIEDSERILYFMVKK